MAYGLRCRDSNGNITLDITDRLSKILVEFSIPVGVHSGTVQIPSYSGSLWVAIYNTEVAAVQLTGSISDVFIIPKSDVQYTISGNTLSWTRKAVTIPYGAPPTLVASKPIVCHVGSY